MAKQKNKLAQVLHYDLYGKRDIKYDFLNKNSISTIDWTELENREPEFFFVKKDWEGAVVYRKGFKLDEIFLIVSTGITTHRDNFVIDDNIEQLKTRIKSFYAFNKVEIFKSFNIKDTSDFDINKAKLIKYSEKYLNNISYRPFDIRWIYYSENLVTRSRKKTMYHMLANNISLVTCKAQNYSTISFISKFIVDTRYYSAPGSIGRDYAFPLYLYTNKKTDSIFKEKNTSASSVQNRKPNLNPEIVSQIANKLNLEFVPEKINNSSLTINNYFAPIDILDYIYAVLHSPTYREKYKEFLKIDFPRVPYPKNAEIFWKLVDKGSQIRELHLLESPLINNLITTFPIAGEHIVEKIKFIGEDVGKVFINKEQYFDKIPKIAWEFYIGGYQPAQKWLKDRKGRALSFEDILHYQKIIIALVNTDRIMKEIDEIDFME